MGCLDVRSDSVFSCVVAATEPNQNSISQVPENSLRLGHRSWILFWHGSRRYHTRMREIRPCASVKNEEEMQWQTSGVCPIDKRSFSSVRTVRASTGVFVGRVDHRVRFQYVVLAYVSSDKRMVLSARFCVFTYQQRIRRLPSSPSQTFPSAPRQPTKLTRRLIRR